MILNRDGPTALSELVGVWILYLSERVASAVVERVQPANCGLFVEEHNISKAGPL